MLLCHPPVGVPGRHQRCLRRTHREGRPTRSSGQITNAIAHPPILLPLHGTCLPSAVAVSVWVAAIEKPRYFARLNLHRVGRLFKVQAQQTEAVLLF